jgi:hypothetical protein
MNAPFSLRAEDTGAEIVDRRAFLARAAARHELVELDEMEVDEAFDALIDQFLHIVFPLLELTRWAEALWDNPGWAEAAREYHAQRGTNTLIVKPPHPKDLELYAKLAEPHVSLDRAWRCLNSEGYLNRSWGRQ